MFKYKFLLITTILAVSIAGISIIKAESKNKKAEEKPMSSIEYDKTKYDSAIFAGGCFWCMVPPFIQLDGVQSVICGYTGGKTENPTYQEVSSGATGHIESVFVIYDPKKVGYKQLLDVFWKNIDPTDSGGQFADRGSQYHTAVFYNSEQQKNTALISKEQLQKTNVFGKPIVTGILPVVKFYRAEEYHQNYYKKNPTAYEFYHHGSGREQFIQKVWKDGQVTFQTVDYGDPSKQEKSYTRPSDAEIKKKLNSLQYEVTQKEGTERPFQNEYWDNHKEGIYVDIVSGEPLFSSADKFESGTGWPSFTKPLEEKNIVTKVDKSFFTTRTEVKSRIGNSHLGHVFDDGPKPTGLRYCMNSAALRFFPKEDLEKNGYGEYTKLFKK